ncbi:MAG TPA: glycosyltransferase family 2 protein [Terriglobales bacterium]|nr:glycosyltransferase family 2 protein [Terriglobales bacterium]
MISVIVPMRNEAGHIGRCVRSILEQDYPADRMEVLVVDGESDDNSREEAAACGPQVRVLNNPGRIVPTAMNIGIRAARGEIIMRVDAHTTLSPDYARIGVETLRRTGADNVGGPMHAIGGGRAANAVAAAMGSRFGIGAYFHFGTEEREVDTVYMGMFPRRIFERIGLFDEELVRNQDDELNYRLRKSGGRIVLTPLMRSRYQNRTSFRKLARQFYQYGVWKVRVLQKHPRQMSPRQFVPPVFVATVLLSALFGLVYSPFAWLCLAVLGAYVLALSAASAITAQRAGWDLFFPILLSFVIMHVSWGTGFLVGAVRFGSRWFGDEPQPPLLSSSSVESSSSGWRSA